MRATQICDLSKLGAGEVPRVSVVSLTRDLAAVVFRHIVGNILARPSLKALVVGEPSSDTITLRHPTGRPVEIKVVAGSRAGASLVARWSAGCIFDEAPRMIGADEGVVNYDDARAAIIGRLLPGAQLISIGSPWAPHGPIYDRVTEHWGKPTQQLVVIRAPAPALNPIWWTPERCAALKEADPVAYQTDVLAEFADAEETLFPAKLIEQSTRSEPGDIPFEPGHEYVAAMDPATRNNAWTLAIATRTGRTKRIVCVRQWQGSRVQPLRPKQVLGEAALACKDYGLDWAYTDQHAADALRDIAEDAGLDLIIEEWTARNRVEAFSALQAEMAEGFVELPPDSLVAKDLKVVKRRAIQNGVTIVLPQTSDGRHADYAVVVAKALHRWIEEEREVAPPQGTKEHTAWLEQQMIAREIDEINEANDRPWWDKG